MTFEEALALVKLLQRRVEELEQTIDILDGDLDAHN